MSKKFPAMVVVTDLATPGTPGIITNPDWIEAVSKALNVSYGTALGLGIQFANDFITAQASLVRSSEFPAAGGITADFLEEALELRREAKAEILAEQGEGIDSGDRGKVVPVYVDPRQPHEDPVLEGLFAAFRGAASFSSKRNPSLDTPRKMIYSDIGVDRSRSDDVLASFGVTPEDLDNYKQHGPVRKGVSLKDPHRDSLLQVLAHMHHPENVWDASKYVYQQKFNKVGNIEAHLVFSYVRGSGYLDGWINNTAVRIYSSNLQGFQVWITPASETFEIQAEGQVPVSFHSDDIQGVYNHIMKAV